MGEQHVHYRHPVPAFWRVLPVTAAYWRVSQRGKSRNTSIEFSDATHHAQRSAQVPDDGQAGAT